MKYSQYNVWAETAGKRWVFNGVSGALLPLTDAESSAADAIVGSGAEPSSDEVLAKLVELVRAGVLRNDDADELHELEQRYLVDRAGAGSMELTIVTSLGCNFDCPYCFEDKHPALLRADVADAIVNMVAASTPGLQHLSITWFGGEPLLGRDALFALSDRLIAICDEGGVAYDSRIITNGWHLTPDVARSLAARRVRAAQVTVDGPPRVHDRTRPHVSGRGTFDRVVDNVVRAADLIDVGVRVNLSRENLGDVEELLRELTDRGLAGRVPVSCGLVIGDSGSASSPLASYTTPTLSRAEYAEIELEFAALARRYGFTSNADLLPAPTRLSCAVITPTSAVIGADGELWKCWDHVGDADEVFGTIHDYGRPAPELRKWATYSPFDDSQCRECVALPVCMGGCPHLAFRHPDRDAQCGTFRFNHLRKVEIAAQRAAGLDPEVATPTLDACGSSCGPGGSSDSPAGSKAAPVQLGPTRRARTMSATS